MNTYPSEFKNQVYILAYGIIGETDHVDFKVYDKHEAFEIDKTKMTMLMPLDINNKSIKNISNLSNNGLMSVHGTVINFGDSNTFVTGQTNLTFKNVRVIYIKLFGSQKHLSKQDVLIIEERGFNRMKYPFTFPSVAADVHIHINRFFEEVYNIDLTNTYDIPYTLVYSLFY